MAVRAKQFFNDILNDLYQRVYLVLGGSIEDQAFNWEGRVLHLAAIGIKIAVLLAFISFWYWVFVYAAKRAKLWFGLSERSIKIARQALRYFWLIASVLAIMTQTGFSPATIKAVAKAANWAGLFYILIAMNSAIVRWFLRQYDLNESIEQLVRNLLLVLLLMLAAGVILAQFGFDIISLVAGLGIVGVAVGFGAQSTLANFIAGIAILVEQSFKVGDWVRVGEEEGRVVKITLRTTHLLSRDNLVVVLPNSTVASSQVVNLTSKTFIRFDVPVRVALHAEVAAARSLILGVLRKNEIVLDNPLSTVTLAKVGEYDLQLVVRFWVAPLAVARLPIIKEGLIENIKTALDAAGIAPPYPHMQLLLDDEARAQTKAARAALILDNNANGK